MSLEVVYEKELDQMRRDLLPAKVLAEIHQIIAESGQGCIMLQFHQGKLAGFEVKRYYKAKSL